MAEINLQDLSMQELQALSSDIDEELGRRSNAERKKVLSQMKELAASVDMTLEEVIAYSSSKKTKGEPKFQNPEDPRQTWTGRGKRPSWIKAALEQGKSLDELRIE